MAWTAQDKASLGASAALCAGAMALAWRWLGVQDIPSGGRDEFFILEVATDLAYRWGREPFGGLSRYVFGDYYPPLARLPGVIALKAGADYRGAVASLWIWLPVGVAGVWSAGRRLGGPAAALLAVALFLAGPGVADCLHHFETNLAPMCAAAGAMAAWLASDHLRRRGPALALGALLGLGLMSDRLGVLPFAIVPILGSLHRGRAWRNAGLAAAITLLLTGWWYADFLSRFLHELLPQLLGGEVSAAGDLVEERAPFPWSWLHYPLLWIDTQLGLVGGGLALLGLAWGARHRERSDVGRVLLWLGAGLLLFTLVPKRQPYYTLPLLPAACVLSGAALDAARRRLGRSGAIGAAALVALAWLPNSVNGGPEPPDWNPGVASWLVAGSSPLPEAWIGRRYPMGGPPVDHGIDLSALPDWLAQHGIGRDDLVLAMSVDSQVTESYLLSLARIARRSVALIGFTLHPDAVVERHGQARALLYVTRSGEEFPTAEEVRLAHEQYFGWDEGYSALLGVPDRLRARAAGGFKQDLREGEVLHLWILE